MCAWSQREATLCANHAIENAACAETAGSGPQRSAHSLSHCPCQGSEPQAVTSMYLTEIFHQEAAKE